MKRRDLLLAGLAIPPLIVLGQERKVEAGYLSQSRPLIAAANSSARWKLYADQVCDGVDDQIDIQAVLDQEGQVELSPGTFVLSGSVTMASRSMAVRGQGQRRTWVNPQGEFAAFRFAESELEISDLAVGRYTSTHYGYGVEVAGGTERHIERCLFHSLVSAVTWTNTTASFWFWFLNNTIMQCDWGLENMRAPAPSEGFYIHGNRFDTLDFDGIYNSVAWAYGFVTGNIFNAVRRGIQSGGLLRFELSNSISAIRVDGMNLSNTSLLRIIGGNVDDIGPGMRGIYFHGGPGTRSTIEGLILSGPGGVGSVGLDINAPQSEVTIGDAVRINGMETPIIWR